MEIKRFEPMYMLPDDEIDLSCDPNGGPNDLPYTEPDTDMLDEKDIEDDDLELEDEEDDTDDESEDDLEYEDDEVDDDSNESDDDDLMDDEEEEPPVNPV